MSTSGNICQSNCQQGEYKNTTNNKCMVCDQSCNNCVSPGNMNSCTSCIGQKYLYNNQCLSSCPSGTYSNQSNNQCLPCYSSCSTCNGPNANNCLSCSGSLFLDSTTNMCNSQCPDSFYANKQNNQCSKCNSTCASCNGGTINDCLTCNPPLFYQASTQSCISYCPSGQFLFQNKCLSKCPDGYYQSSADNSCVQCNKSCSTCSSISQCSSCITPFIFFNNQCLSQCPQGYYFSLISNQCKSCSKSCQSCSGPEESQCITCVPGTYLQGTTCLSTCQEGYYQDNTLCSKCSSTCQTCIGPNQDQCLTCQDNLQLFHSQCLNECPSGTYQGKDNQNKCYPCNSSCTLSCSGPSEEECSTIKPQSQIIVYILIAKTVLWIFSSIIGLVKDKNNQESQNLKIIPSSQQSGGKLDQDGESPIILKKQSLFSNNEIQNEDCTQKQGNQIIQSSIQNIQNDELQNQISNQYLPNIEINENTQKGYNRRRPRKIHLILQQKSIKSTVFGVNGFYNYANSTFQSGTENNIKEKSQTYDQQATLQNISPISKSKICILGQEKDIIKKYQANQKFRFSILGNEWVELFTFYDAFVSRATRATLIYLKYHIYIYMCELFKFSPLYFLLLSLACGLGLNCRLMVLAYPQDNQNEPQYGFQLELIIYNYLFCRFSYTIISFRLAQISEHNQFFKQKQQQPWTLQNIQK
ncbi:hypothetical protein ABPG74_010146 [Tetrahymena malaccensis]